jgi:hypothetical protein
MTTRPPLRIVLAYVVAVVLSALFLYLMVLLGGIVGN